jgi:glucose/arabinose dehydrogenase
MSTTVAATKQDRSRQAIEGAGEAPGTATTVASSGAFASARCLAPTAGRLGGALACAILMVATSSCGSQPSSQAQPLPLAVSAPIANVPLFSPAVPTRHYFDPNNIPPPFATPSVRNNPRIEPRPQGAQLHVPPGFAIDTWASGLPGPRAMALAPNGDVFVAESGAGTVAVLRDDRHGGTADVVSAFATGLNKPFGIAFYPPGRDPSYVYIANTDSVVRYAYRTGDLTASGPAQTIIPGLPANGYNNHWTRRLLFTPDGKRLLVSVGSAANVEATGESDRADILSYNPDGTGLQIYAWGLRNPVGLAWNPVTGVLWTAVNERDGMGDDVPNDYVTSVKPGGFYGWPFYYLGQNHDERMPDRPDLKPSVVTPDVLLQAHCAALSIIFYNAHQFPAAYFHQGFTAMHGSWNRSTRSGYEVAHILMNPDGTAHGDYEDFVWGWAMPDGGVWGRPVDTLVASDGSLLITDDGAGKMWRVWYVGKKG